jgi:hypothetical protein
MLQNAANAATAITQNVTNISYNNATGNGIVRDPFIVNAYGVCWNTAGDPNLGDDNCTNEAEGVLRGEDLNFSSVMSGLEPGTRYFVRAYARDWTWWGGVISYGAVVEFTTTRLIPTVTTQAVTDIKSKSALGHGTVEDLGLSNPTQHGVCWNSDGDPTIDDKKTEEGALYATGPFATEIKGLKSNRTYFVRAYATNHEGTAYGNEVVFTTSPSLPIVSTLDVDEIDSNNATVNGTIIDIGAPNPNQHGFCWNTTGMPDLGDTITEQGDVNMTGPFSSVISELIPDITYYVRAYATNTAGTSYGNEVSFSTTNNSDRSVGIGEDVYGYCFIETLNTINMVLMHGVIVFSGIVLAIIYFKRRRR